YRLGGQLWPAADGGQHGHHQIAWQVRHAVKRLNNFHRVVGAPLGGTIACVPTAGGGVRPSPDPTFMRGVLDLSLRPIDDLPEAELLLSEGVSSAELDIPRLAALLEQLGGHIDAVPLGSS